MDTDLVPPLAPKVFLKVTFSYIRLKFFLYQRFSRGITQLLCPFKNPTAGEILYHIVHHIAANQEKNEPGGIDDLIKTV